MPPLQLISQIAVFDAQLWCGNWQSMLYHCVKQGQSCFLRSPFDMEFNRRFPYCHNALKKCENLPKSTVIVRFTGRYWPEIRSKSAKILGNNQLLRECQSNSAANSFPKASWPHICFRFCESAIQGIETPIEIIQLFFSRRCKFDSGFSA